MNIEECLVIVLGEQYYTPEDLRYNKKVNLLLGKTQFADFLKLKEKLLEEGNNIFKKIPLKTFNSKYCFYVQGNYLMSKYSDYLSAFIDSIEGDASDIQSRNMDDILMSRVFSEIEGTLRIENVPTTHKRIKEVLQAETLTDKNDIIIKNMLNAMQFIVMEKPLFNQENLYKMYQMLSDGCLPEESKLKEGYFYRDEAVYIGGFEGADYRLIPECMDSLFAFVNDEKLRNEVRLLLPHICHYYLLYIHPYFDYNGRTARMVSFWLSYLYLKGYAPLYLSEAINECKGAYYKAIVNTRTTNNDLTYFLGFILESALKFNFVYKNLEGIKKKLLETGDFLTPAELMYLKKIMIHNSENYFNCKMFFEYVNGSMSKVAGLKVLNHMSDYGILLKSKNKKKEVVFKINPDFLTYKV